MYLLACRGPSLYVGITRDLTRRLAAHQAGRGGAYTRSHRPVRLVYQEVCPDHAAALRREAQIRRWPRQQKLALSCTSASSGSRKPASARSSVS